MGPSEGALYDTTVRNISSRDDDDEMDGALTLGCCKSEGASQDTDEELLEQNEVYSSIIQGDGATTIRRCSDERSEVRWDARAPAVVSPHCR
jgi:hypothetical protein